MRQTPTPLQPDLQLERDPLARIAVSAGPVVLEGRYRLLMRALWELRHSRRTRWGLGVGSAAVMLLLAFLAVRHFATTSWPLSRGEPGLLVAAGLLLLLAQALKAFGWARLFTNRERPSPVALVAGNGGAALIGVVLPGRFDDAMRIAIVRRYPGCPAGLRAISLSLVMLGLIDSAALAPLAAVAVAFPGAGVAARVALGVVAGAGIAAAAVIVALPRLIGSERALRFRVGRWLSPRTTSLARAAQAWGSSSAAGSPAAWPASFCSARSDWVIRSHSRFCFSAPVPPPRPCRSGPPEQLPRRAPEPPRSRLRV